jgi:hypothetical protein
MIAEAGESSGTQRKGIIRRWKTLQSNDSEDSENFVCYSYSDLVGINQ